MHANAPGVCNGGNCDERWVDRRKICCVGGERRAHSVKRLI